MRRITRSLSVVAMMLTMIAGVFAAGATAGTVQAHPAAANPLAVPHHDMSHPVKANYPCVGQPRSGIAKMGTTPTFNCRQNSQPGAYANNQSGKCNNGVTYLQGFTNVPGYSSSTVVSTFYSQLPYASYNPSNGQTDWSLNPSWPNQSLTAMVQYYWCPSSLYSNGINYAYARLYYTSGCGNIYMQNEAGIQQANGTFIGDGESTPYWLCSGNYAWSYSNVGNGAYTWEAVASMSTVYPIQPEKPTAVYLTTPYYR